MIRTVLLAVLPLALSVRRVAGGKVRVGIKVVELSAEGDSQKAKKSISRIRFWVGLNKYIQ